jgi:cyclic lactone autoinducer peptide
MKKSQKIEKMVAKLALKTAVSACGAASNWNVCQPVEPKSLKKFSK